MSEEVPIANPPLSDKERAAVEKFAAEDFEVIDAAILASCSSGWLKVARVMVDTERSLANDYPSLSYVFYTERLRWLVNAGHLESQGNLAYMRFSEVRIPAE